MYVLGEVVISISYIVKCLQTILTMILQDFEVVKVLFYWTFFFFSLIDGAETGTGIHWVDQICQDHM